LPIAEGGRDSEARAARRLAGLQTVRRVLDHEAARRREPQTFRGEEKDLGIGFLPLYVFTSDDGVERRGGQADLAQVSVELYPVGAGRDRDPEPVLAAGMDELDRSR